MGLSMFIQQRLTPQATVDPIQKKIFTFMPVIFTYLFASLPSGVVIYWALSTLIGIIQQLITDQIKGKK